MRQLQSIVLASFAGAALLASIADARRDLIDEARADATQCFGKKRWADSRRRWRDAIAQLNALLVDSHETAAERAMLFANISEAFLRSFRNRDAEAAATDALVQRQCQKQRASRGERTQ